MINCPFGLKRTVGYRYTYVASSVQKLRRDVTMVTLHRPALQDDQSDIKDRTTTLAAAIQEKCDTLLQLFLFCFMLLFVMKERSEEAQKRMIGNSSVYYKRAIRDGEKMSWARILSGLGLLKCMLMLLVPMMQHQSSLALLSASKDFLICSAAASAAASLAASWASFRVALARSVTLSSELSISFSCFRTNGLMKRW